MPEPHCVIGCTFDDKEHSAGNVTHIQHGIDRGRRLLRVSYTVRVCIGGPKILRGH